MYKAPIELLSTQMSEHKFDTEKMVIEAVFKTGVNVDKYELIRALQYDRDQYDKGYADAKTEVAREIFEEIENRLAIYAHIHRYAKEAYEVEEEYADGSPVEMTSVWDACRLEHNGYDDYETMCQLNDNIGYIAKSHLLEEIEKDITYFKKKYTERET